MAGDLHTWTAKAYTAKDALAAFKKTPKPYLAGNYYYVVSFERMEVDGVWDYVDEPTVHNPKGLGYATQVAEKLLDGPVKVNKVHDYYVFEREKMTCKAPAKGDCGSCEIADSCIEVPTIDPAEKVTEAELSQHVAKDRGDAVNPSHYRQHPAGIECIDVVEPMDLCIGNAIKYLWRCGLKREQGLTEEQKAVEDLRKAIWYIERKIASYA